MPNHAPCGAAVVVGVSGLNGLRGNDGGDHRVVDNFNRTLFGWANYRYRTYYLHVTLRARLKPLALGLTPRAVLDKFAAIQMLDVHFPTTDGRTLILSQLDLPPQPPPRITAPEKIARLPANAV
jgi:hypothetical protein